MDPDPSAVISLSFCGSVLRLGATAFELIAQRENVGAFRLETPGGPSHFGFDLQVGRRDGGWSGFGPSSGAIGSFRLASTGIEVTEETNAIGLSLALRALFSLAVERLGGVLVHASCVSWDGHAALITGVSGTGKSTLARWGLRAGATLLSDEVVGVLPDGTVLGTPFRSDPDLLGTPTMSRLAVVATVKHAASEGFEVRPANELVELLCEQTFNRGGELTARQVLGCVHRAIEGSKTGDFACRDAPEAGHVLRELVLAQARTGFLG